MCRFTIACALRIKRDAHLKITFWNLLWEEEGLPPLLNPRIRRELHRALMQIATDACPFLNLPNSRKSHWGEGITAEQMREIQWVRPHVVAQVSFTEWTSGGKLR